MLLLLLVVFAGTLVLPRETFACACCADPGQYRISFSKPAAYQLELMKQMRFGPNASLFSTEAGPEGDAKGLPNAAETYSLNGSLFGRLWKLMFSDAGKSGGLNLTMPAKVLMFSADIHDGQIGGGGGPVLYKEWRFEGTAGGTGLFKPGFVAPAKYFLVLQGRGNNCDNADDFTHWRLEIKGGKADYAFYGPMAKSEPLN